MYEPTKLDILISVVEGSGSQHMASASRAMTVRFPIHLYAAIQALAELSSTGKGAVAVTLVDSAIEQLEERLTPDTRESFKNLQGKFLQEMAQEECFPPVETDSFSMGGDQS